MPHTFDSALSDDLVHIVERDDEAGSFVITIGDLQTLISIELGRYVTDERTKVRVSHMIKTPMQAGPYTITRPFWDYPAYALHQAVTALTQYYKQAVAEGHLPEELWLLEKK